MSHPSPKHRFGRRRALSALLCGLLLCGSAVPAAAAPPPATGEAASVLEELLQGEAPVLDLEEPSEPDVPSSPEEPGQPSGPEEPGGPDEDGEEPGQPEEPGDPEGPETPDNPEEPEEPPARFTLTFHMGRFGTETLEVEEGQCPDPEAMPEVPEMPFSYFVGWFDANGKAVDPATLPVTQDAAYTARWGRKVAEFLDTDSHDAYISGYSNGMFRPGRNVTRAEAAQLLYNLLRERTGEPASFTDVKDNDWFASAAYEMSSLGILSGYGDGSFRPNRAITRAEFVKMAVGCDTLLQVGLPFSDVPADSWAFPYVATACFKGWIGGYGDGTFKPDAPITRAEAVTVLNKMLGRKGDASIKSLAYVKNFYDLFPESWYYAQVVEASTAHTHETYGDTERWTSYEEDHSTAESGWVNDGGNRYYLDGKTRKFLRGQQTIEGKKYLLGNNGAAVTGFQSQGTWRRYYLNGLLQEDISGLGVVSGPYYIKVYKPSNYLIVFAKENGKGSFNVPVKAIRTSCGYGTPTGNFRTPYRYRWLEMIGGTWAQWCTQISGSYLFHSVPNWTHNNFDLEVGEYNHLGDTRSAGCIRMNCRDAKWIYDNCQLGTEVTISSWETGGPLSKPAGLQIPSWHTWDPTDPTANWKCAQRGCH